MGSTSPRPCSLCNPICSQANIIRQLVLQSRNLKVGSSSGQLPLIDVPFEEHSNGYCKFISVSSRGFGVGALNDNVLMSSWARAVQWGKLHVGTNEDNFLLVRWSIGTRCQPDLSGPKQQKPLPLLQPPHLGSSRLLSQAKDMKSEGSFKQAPSCKCKSIPNQSFPSQRQKSTRLSIRPDWWIGCWWKRCARWGHYERHQPVIFT